MGTIGRKAVAEAKKILMKKFRGKPGFIGAGIGEGADGAPIVIAFVETSEIATKLQLPADLNGIPLQIEVTGRPRKF